MAALNKSWSETMNLSQIFAKECVSIGEKFAGRDEALKKIAALAKKSPYASSVDQEDIFQALHARENLCSTGFGDGIAIPHCKLPGIQNFIAGIITVPDGVNFDAIDHRDIRLIVFLIGPKDLINDHIRLLAVISQKLHQKGFIEQLISEVKEENIIQCLVENPRIDLPHPCMHAGYDLLNIFVQDEEWFNEILQVLTGYESSQVVILDAQFEGSYLVKQPLFSNVWNDTNHKFCKVILAAIEKGVSGDIIRQLDHIVDGLDDCERLMITLQPLIYKAGALQF